VAVYQLTAPDGSKYQITAPDTASQDDVLKYAQSQWQAKPAPAPQPESPIPTGPLSALPDWAQAATIGAGKTLSDVGEGLDQIKNSALVAGKQLFGMDNSQELKALAEQEQLQKSNAPAYQALQQQHPFATGVGEALPSLAIPMGAPTMAGRILAPAIGYGALQAAQYGSPAERALKGAAGFGSGLVGGAVGEGVSRLIQPVSNVANTAAQDAAQAAAAKIGAPMLPSQIAGSPSLARVEDALARYPGSAGVMQNFLAKQQGAVNAAAQRAVMQPGEDLTADGLNAAKAALGAQYNSLRSQIPDGLPASQPVFDAIDAATQKLSQGSISGKQGALDMLSELKDRLYSTKALTPDEYSAWVSDLAAAARQSQNPTVSAALKGVGAQMDAIARGPLNPQWQSVDQAYSALKTLQKPGVVNPATGNVSAVKVANQLERSATGARATDLADIAQYARAVPQLRAGSPTAERSAVNAMGAVNALWRYPLAKLLTSGVMNDYLAKGILASPEASGVAAGILGRAAVPLGVVGAPGAGMAGLGLLGRAVQNGGLLGSQ